MKLGIFFNEGQLKSMMISKRVNFREQPVQLLKEKENKIIQISSYDEVEPSREGERFEV